MAQVIKCFLFSILKTILSLIYIETTIMTFTPINELPKPAQFLLDELEKEEEKEILLNNYMKEILETHPVTNLKSILREMKQEVGSYSKMKKAELISRIIALKKKGFPVPKVEKYVKPARKKTEPKAPAPVQGPNAPAPVQGPNAPAPNNDDKFTSMTKREYLKYLKGLPNKIPDPDNAEAVDVFLKAHEGLGYAWQFVQNVFEPKTQFKKALDFYNSKSKKDKLKILELYSIPQDKLKKINHPKGHKQAGMLKTEIVERVFNKPSEAEFKKLQKETKELYEELENRYTTKAKVLKTRSKESKKKAKELYDDLEDKYFDLLTYGREPYEYLKFSKFRELIRKKGL
jgi:hypothetical protein